VDVIVVTLCCFAFLGRTLRFFLTMLPARGDSELPENHGQLAASLRENTQRLLLLSQNACSEESPGGDSPVHSRARVKAYRK